MREIPILFARGRYWVIEEKVTEEYPGSPENPAYFCSPIYLNDNKKLEMRSGGADWISHYESRIGHNFSDKEINEIRESIKEFLEFLKRMMKEDFHGSDEYKIFYPLIK